MANDPGNQTVAEDRKRAIAAVNKESLTKLAARLYDNFGNVDQPVAKAMKRILDEIVPPKT